MTKSSWLSCLGIRTGVGIVVAAVGTAASVSASAAPVLDAPEAARFPISPRPIAETAGTLEALLAVADSLAPAHESAALRDARRARILDRVQYSPRCFAPDSSPEQLAEIVAQYDTLPPGMLVNGERFFTSGTVWTGNSSQGPSGRAIATTLRYSFPPDGIAWGNTSSLNNLNAQIEARFGTNNSDRGREYIRQALASWRRASGLTYNEVSDNGSAFSFSTTASGTGDIRIGSIPQDGQSGVLAYNYFPNSGGDMTIDSGDFTTGSLWNSSANYRFLRNVISHEHGHGTGYIHSVPCNGSKLMEPFAGSGFDTLQIDDIRGAQRNYGDRFAGNNSAANAKDFGNLTSPIVKSVIERYLSTNGAGGFNNSDEDWFRFTLGSTQNVVITIDPIGGSYSNGQQTSGCSGSTSTVNADQAGNLNVELRDSSGNTVLFTAASAAAGANEVITATGLSAGTYTVRVVDVGPNSGANQTVQLYDMTIRVGTSKAPPQAVAGINKRVAAGQTVFFMGDINSRVTDSGVSLNSASYDWDLDGNGVFETTDQPQPTFVYPSNGIFNATLRVTDSAGMSATDTITVTVVGAVSGIISLSPSSGPVGSIVPITITGVNLGGVTSASQVSLSGTGTTITGTPVVSGGGSTITGLSIVVDNSAPTGPRILTITNADGTGQNAQLINAFTVNNAPPGNDDCTSPISWGSLTGPRPFTNFNATTGASQSFPGTGCPAAGPINNDVWYTWQAPGNGTLQISTDSATQPNPFSSRVAVYAGTACPPGAALGCDDFGFAFNISVAAGQTYLFQVGSVFAGTTGTANVLLGFTEFMGACCSSDGSCSTTTASTCVGTSVFQGPGTTCTVGTCPEPNGTCCDVDGSCIITTVSNCSGTSWAGGGVCSPNPCPQPMGSCCLSDGSCTESDESDCTAASGVWTLNASCSPNPCAQPTGACCAPNGSCTATTQAACADSFQGPGSVCIPTPCPQPTGACCAADGSCSVATQSACTGAYQGDDSACAPNPCPQPTGACCTGATCSLTLEAGCTGTFAGAGTACNAPGNNTTPCCRADINQSGSITVQDIFDFLAGYFAGMGPADFNESGTVTVQDIFDFLSAYFAGCQ